MPGIKHILFPFDFSAQGQLTVPLVAALAERLDARVSLFSAVPPVHDAAPPVLGPDLDADPAQWTRLLQSRLDSALLDELAGLTVQRVADAGDPAMRVVAFAAREQVDLIMMPTHSVGLLKAMLVGSVTARVLRDAACPVWTAAHMEAHPSGALPRSVLCAVDGTPASQALIQWAAGFSRDCDAALTLLYVVPSITDAPSIERERVRQDRFCQLELTRLESIRRDAGVDAPLRAVVGSVVPCVTEEARRARADLIIIGRGQVAQPFGRLRTHAFGIIQRAPCPVLSV